MKLPYKKQQDSKYPFYELVPGIIVAHAGIQGGAPTVKGTRVTTQCAFKFAYKEKNWGNWHLTKQQAFAVMCFEAGIEYHKKHLAIDKEFTSFWQGDVPTAKP